MTDHLTSVAIASALLFSFASPVRAEGMPAHIQKMLGKFVGEWNVETVLGGETFKSVAVVKWSDDQKCLILSAKGKSFVTGEDATTTDIMGWDDARKLVAEYAINGDGSGAKATHQISEDGEWTSPIHGWSIVDSVPAHFEGLRRFTWKSDNELEVKFTHLYGRGQRAPDMTSVFRRK
ncbi:MAG: hypothetical protein MUF48_23495 [Pirellulaceae bacterium]|jgi:hypothetical protein|nr:hypothetical protein [Pirellulaceae bacterium]